MPFVQRVVNPIYLSRTKKTTAAAAGTQAVTGTTTIVAATTTNSLSDFEFEAVTNLTLSNALRQLASLVLIADDIFKELNRELNNVSERAGSVKIRIGRLAKSVDEFDPKLVAVPESDLETFVQIKNHFHTNRPIDTLLFTPSTRSEQLQQLYDAAAKTPVNTMEEMDRILGQTNHRSSDIFLCTPVLGHSRRRMKSNVDVEIETRTPAAVEELRKWTSTEAIGDTTVSPDCRVGFNSQNNTTITNASHSLAGQSTDVTDDFTVISRINADTNDMPLDHRLPSPEEQCQTIALKFPAVVIKVDTSGKRFDRMCNARKSMLNVPLRIGEHNNLNDEVQTIKRRSRSRKPRNKRRNTIAGTDQKEIEEAVKGDDDIEPSSTLPVDENTNVNIVPRSKSNDILKNDLPSSASDTVKAIQRLSHFNTLKQWGRNRLRLMNRNAADDTNNKKDKVSDIDDINVYETVISKNKRKFMEKERKLSHERKPSYSSSEKSLSITMQSTSHSHLPASINPVKLRESSSIRRQRRSGLGHKDELNSSSGNWSASSESGRTSIGSEITAQPKSSASSTSLNHSHHHPGSGPPSSIISRRRFLNTSASSSVTSEGTVTPDIQVHDSYDDETSSAYSCDTEGYYTSFHSDSGLKTLKEEEPVTPLHSSSALSSTNSFGSSSNKTVLSAENEYELFGKGSTSTTASSAGTVCTTLMAAESDKCLLNGPAVPERKSSLTKLHRSGSTASNSTLERSYSSSTVGSTLERTGTIKRNGILLKKENSSAVSNKNKSANRIESPDSGNNTSTSPIETNSSSSPAHEIRSNSEFEYSESSDLEGVERVERIRVKTTINSSRIPSLCVITPSNSDDDEIVVSSADKKESKIRERHASPVKETNLDEILLYANNKETVYATILPSASEKPIPSTKQINEFKKDVQHIKKATLLPLNSMFGRLRGVLPHLKKSPHKDSTAAAAIDPIYDNAGEYVTIADVKNNNQKKNNNGTYYANDMVKRNLATVLSGNLNEETEYVSLNELPSNIRCESNLLSGSSFTTSKRDEKINNHPNMDECYNSSKNEEGHIKKGARVTLDAQGKVVYSSDSLKRRKGAHTTFAPGPCVKNSSSSSTVVTNKIIPSNVTDSPGGVSNRKLNVVRPVISQSLNKPILVKNFDTNKQADKVVIRADVQNSAGTTQEIVRMPIATVVATTQNDNDIMASTIMKGAYVNVQGKPVVNSNCISSINSTDIQPKRDLPHLSHDQYDGHYERLPYVSSTLPRLGGAGISSESRTAAEPSSSFQRNNNIYWTLQTRKQLNKSPGREDQQSKDDFIVINQNVRPIEELYSTPNKIKKSIPQLKSTPIGFSTFFSPVKSAENNTSDNFKISPIDPRNTGSFKTSTPSKQEGTAPAQKTNSSLLSDELRLKLHIQEGGGNFHSNTSSPISSGRSTPRIILEPQSGRNADTNDLSQTCSDRLGTPKTSLMDFKKLLLSKAGKTPIAKPSAVEQLKLARDAVKPAPQNANVSCVNILDLSGSPKTFANRRMIRQGNFGVPNKATPPVSKHMSPRSAWKYNNFRTDVMSTAILEVNSEEDSSPNNSNEKRKSSLTDVSPNTNETINEKEESVVHENINIKNNPFLQAEENNFMKGEIATKPISCGMSRAQLLQARSQFLMSDNSSGGAPAQQQQQQSIRSAQFKNGHYTGISPTRSVIGTIQSNTEKSIDTSSGGSAQSLETAL